MLIHMNEGCKGITVLIDRKKGKGEGKGKREGEKERRGKDIWKGKIGYGGQLKKTRQHR